MALRYYEGVGRRKEATARARLYPQGNGAITVNGKPLKEYFGREIDWFAVQTPLRLTNTEAVFNVSIQVKGGGITGQAEAARMAIARALLKFNPELRPTLKAAGLLRRDPRVKERKKPGLKRARKAPTYTKR
ncbi:MAG: 30S ribosomal protein S9 [Thermoflexales bacterium]|nr:30S ribosomal protein S9 [Thermoflexales bacterium]MCS7324605.1 30S ribosomal protein S9 [Thermoflexales bacterium]MCX7940075.1 30S ribosomal protein S9 [Thermoflexales bacterium]